MQCTVLNILNRSLDSYICKLYFKKQSLFYGEKSKGTENLKKKKKVTLRNIKRIKYS